MGHTQDEKYFFGRNNKSRSSAFRKFLFYQNIICLDWVMNPFLFWVMPTLLFFGWFLMKYVSRYN